MKLPLERKCDMLIRLENGGARGKILPLDQISPKLVGLGDYPESPAVLREPPALGPSGNDSCAAADPIAGEGTFAFNNAAATTDGNAHGACLFFGADQIDNDVWFSWTAPCDGQATISMCGGTGVDTKVAIYDGGAACAPGDDDLLACNDDFCGLQSQTDWSVSAGSTYLIRIGTFPGALGGAGTFDLSCLAVGGSCGSDSCATPDAIAGEGDFCFDNTTATTDGIPHPACLFFGADQIDSDVWFCWTARPTATSFSRPAVRSSTPRSRSTTTALLARPPTPTSSSATTTRAASSRGSSSPPRMAAPT